MLTVGVGIEPDSKVAIALQFPIQDKAIAFLFVRLPPETLGLKECTFWCCEG
jgi:hypothetical protein